MKETTEGNPLAYKELTQLFLGLRHRFDRLTVATALVFVMTLASCTDREAKDIFDPYPDIPVPTEAPRASTPGSDVPEGIGEYPEESRPDLSQYQYLNEASLSFVNESENAEDHEKFQAWMVSRGIDPGRLDGMERVDFGNGIYILVASFAGEISYFVPSYAGIVHGERNANGEIDWAQPFGDSEFTFFGMWPSDPREEVPKFYSTDGVLINERAGEITSRAGARVVLRNLQG